ncbi:MAG: hypothetical protein ABR953_02690 [Candidatus Acidiferrales bacterium]|jgi:hypothetical protein
MRRTSLLAAVVLSVSVCGWLGVGVGERVEANGAAGAYPGRGSAEQVGRVNFPTSCAAAARGALEKGLATLHSFQYQESEQAFTNASEQDARCAIAYWGKAMALYHQLWDFPDLTTLGQGRNDVEQAQKLNAGTDREREYIAAAAAFYQDDAKLIHTARVQAYSLALKKLYQGNPKDNEAGEFYALSLIALAQLGVDDLANRKQAIAILNPIFAEYPNNPGAAHYLIHASDEPELASQGLAAARAYAKIAPDSSHAIHMPSHIFRRLGLWQEVIDSNIAAVAAAARATEEHRGDASYQFHAMDFLDYAYLQSGQEAKARQLVEEVKSVPGASAADIVDHQDMLAARNALELQRWKEAAALEIPIEKPDWQDITYWTRAIGAARMGAAEEARQDTQKLTEIISARRARNAAQGATVPAGEDTSQSEAEAWVAFAEGKPDEAVAKLRDAARQEENEHEDPFAVPAREMLADLLLALKRPSDALVEYKAVLRDYPNRFDALYGAARAAQSMGERRAASGYYAKLVAICPRSADRPELHEAHGYVAANRD